MGIGDSLNGGIISDISWDGSRLFYYVRYDTSISLNVLGSNSGPRFFYRNHNGAFDYLSSLAFTTSDTVPTNITQQWVWYDTSTNIMKRTTDTGATWVAYQPFPLILGTITNGIGVTSIEQVFNSIGYIGSTVWVGKGLKGLIPNGRDENGELINIEYTQANVAVWTQGNTFTGSTILMNKDILSPADYIYTEVLHLPSSSNRTTWTAYFVTSENKYYWVGENVEDNLQVYMFKLATCDLNNGQISNFQQKYPFVSLDKNDTNFIAQQAMPSDRYIDLTLGATGTTYTAPGDGYICFSKSSTASGQFIGLGGANRIETISFSTSSGNLCIFIPIRKGYSFYAYYSAAGETRWFRFLFIEGSK